VAARVRKLLDTRRRAAIVQMMDQHNRRDPVGPLVFGLSVVLASFTVVVGALLFFPPEGEPDWPGRAFVWLARYCPL
jgi:hypothetical protein